MKLRSSFDNIQFEKGLLLFFLIAGALSTFSQTTSTPRTISVTNDARPSSKKGYYDWVVYLAGNIDTLKKVSHVVYTLHSSFKNPVQTVYAKQSNVFRYCASGWGEFPIKAKIIFFDKRRKPLELKYQLSFRNKRTRYLCN